METKQLNLTKAQADCASWVLGCPLFCDEDVAGLSHGWDVSEAAAADILAAAKACSLNGLVLTVATDARVLGYMQDYAGQLVEMGAQDAADWYIGQGDDEKTARCKANASVKAASYFADKLSSIS